MISVIIPAFNESERIGSTINALVKTGKYDEIVVVNDGSSDSTSTVAAENGATRVIDQKNWGKGAALNAGIAAATGDILVLLDADLGETASEAVKLLPPIISGEADMTIATFPVIPGKGGGFGFVVRLAREGIHRLTGKTMQAPLSGQRAFRREVIEKIGPVAPGFEAEVALTVDALRSGYVIQEVPTEMTHRVTGRDFKANIHRLKQYLAVRAALAKRRRS